jgi:hypothetical protein
MIYLLAALFGLPQSFAQESEERTRFEELFQTLDAGWCLITTLRLLIAKM